MAPSALHVTRYRPGEEYPCFILVQVKVSSVASDQEGKDTLQAASKAAGSDSLADRWQLMVVHTVQ